MSTNRVRAGAPLRYVALALFSVLPLLAGCETDTLTGPVQRQVERAAATLPTGGNYAIQFDGMDDRVNLSPNPVGEPQSFTVEHWVRIDRAKIHMLVTNAQDDGNDGFTLLVDGNNNLMFIVASSWNVKAVAVGSTALQIGQWYHVAGTHDAQNNTVKIFVDGVEDASVNYGSGINYSAGRDLRFGMQVKTTFQGSRFLQGALDDVRIWDFARSAGELAADKDHEADPSAPGLVGYWPMNEGTGTTTADATTGNNVGTLERGPVWIQGPPLASAPGNQAPVADAGPDRAVDCTSPDGAAVVLTGAGSSDPDQDPLTYTWTDSQGNVVGTGSPVTVNLAMGTYTFTLTVSDGSLEDSDDVVITVHDATPPTVTAALEPIEVVGDEGLFKVVFSCSDLCDVGPVSAADINGVEVTNGQIVELSLQDGAQMSGWDAGVLEIEAPSFLLTVTCTDASGNVGTAMAIPAFGGVGSNSPYTTLYVEEGELKLDGADDRYRFEVRGTFVLGSESDGIDPLTEDVVVTFDQYSKTIPAGSFFREDDEYRYEGFPPGINRIDLEDDGEFQVEARGLPLSGIDLSGPVGFSLQIGNDVAETGIYFHADGGGEWEFDGEDSDEEDHDEEDLDQDDNE